MKTVTFYSYKGGLGRSLLLANMAHILCAAGKCVFALDLDFEAPGLHYKLSPDFIQKQGALDYIVKVQRGEPPGLLKEYVETFDRHKNLFLLSAGQMLTAPYLERLSELDTVNLFATADSAGFDAFALLRQNIIDDYAPDYLLIDSRTGMTQIGTFALKYLADMVVCLFSCVEESYQGAQLAMSAVERSNPENGSQPKRKIFPVISRVVATTEGHRLAEAYCRKVIEKLTTVLGEDVSKLHSDASFEVDDRVWADANRSLASSVLLGDTVAMARKLFAGDAAVIEMLSPVSVPSLLQSSQDQQSPVAIIDRLRCRENRPSGRRDQGGSKSQQLLIKIDKRYVKGKAYRDWVDQIIGKLLTKAIGAPPNAAELVRTFGAPDDTDIVWDEIPELMRAGALDFCADPYYMNKSRQLFLGHFPFAVARNFTLVVVKGSAIDKRLQDVTGSGTEGRPEAQSLQLLLQSLLETLEFGLEPSHIWGLQDTTATSECQGVLSSLGHFAAEMKLVERPSELLKDLPDYGLAVADFGLVKAALTELSPDQSKRIAYGTYLTVKYRNGPVPVGFIYPREDAQWGCSIAAVIGEMISEGSLNESTWSKVAQSLNDVDLEACTFDELCFIAARGMPMREGLKWLRDQQSGFGRFS